ncbi:MAG TPA: radical SAM family heme chaperone HemW [Flavisolibacter sp.]|nr:radical SAM family heme chaperone HemW [Flavisolibacter sp.]
MHIPFCKQACTYCNFHFTTSLRYKDEMVEALISEVKAEKDYLGGEPVNTLYFGGGTPSLLSLADCAALLEAIQKYYPLAPDAEITLEANPDDIDSVKLQGWKALGINRLSIGVQSFFEEELRWMNRAHNARQALECIEWSHQFGLTNLSIDLIYGSPLLTDEMWKQNVDRASSLGITHLSCYALTVEEKTPLQKFIHTKKTNDVNPDRQASQFLLLMQWLREKGYEHYEVSNFALPGFRSRHNSSYWKGEKYLGLGPSAHSFNGAERRWNAPNNQAYIAGSKEGLFPREKELLTAVQQLNEYIMISLRTKEGLDLSRVEKMGGEPEKQRVVSALQKFSNSGLVHLHQSGASLTDEGMLMADGIASDLFF